MAITEFSFSVDDFQNPKVYKDPEAIQTLLTRLLLLEPGTIQSHPDMGVGLYSKYSHSVMNSGEDSKLQSDFQSQIEKYLPQFQGARVTVKEQDKAFMISTELDNVLYGVYYEKNTTNITAKFTRLSEL